MAELLLNSSPDGLLLVDPTGEISLANRSAEAIFGYEPDGLVGTSVDELVPIESRGGHAAHRASFAAHPTSRPMGTDLRLLAQHRAGDLFPVEISLSPIDFDGRVQTIATVRDVTERQDALARVALLKDRERIARDLHDMVIQRIFAAGMSLQSVTTLVDSPVARERIMTVTDELDETISELRTAIFQLGHAETHHSLAGHVTELVNERSRQLGFAPELVIDGDLDTLPEFVAEQLVATLTEALSNVARHAGATAATIEIARADGGVTLNVSDNGIGFAKASKVQGGLSNMMWRAAELGGSCSVNPGTDAGTHLSWHVPL